GLADRFLSRKLAGADVDPRGIDPTDVFYGFLGFPCPTWKAGDDWRRSTGTPPRPVSSRSSWPRANRS
ncbi:hypothetical protein, partial [Bradyrhizobium sp. P5_C11_2]